MTMKRWMKKLLSQKDTIRVAVTGSRRLKHDVYTPLIYDYLDDFFSEIPTNRKIIIASGLAKGPDQRGITYAESQGYDVERFEAQWTNGGEVNKNAGIERNIEMIDTIDVLIAFWDGKSNGTKHAIQYAAEKKKIVIVYILPIIHDEEAEERNSYAQKQKGRRDFNSQNRGSYPPRKW